MSSPMMLPLTMRGAVSSAQLTDAPASLWAAAVPVTSEGSKADVLHGTNTELVA